MHVWAIITAIALAGSAVPGQSAPPPRFASVVQDAVERAHAAERNGREKAAEAREAERQSIAAASRAREAAQKAENGIAGYKVKSEAEDGKLRVRYEGQVSSDGARNGYGVETWSDGERYEGQFRADAMNGVGTYMFRDGERTFGQERNDSLEGLGVYIWPGGDSYEGQEHNGNDDGAGVYYGGPSSALREWAGQFRNDDANGYAVVYWKNGTVSIGYWDGDRMNGYGARLDAKGKVIEQGLYKNGKLKKAMAP